MGSTTALERSIAKLRRASGGPTRPIPVSGFRYGFGKGENALAERGRSIDESYSRRI
jgi:hypothetical protein